MPTIMVKVDLECSRCHAKIQKILNRIQEKGEFCIDGIEYDEKNNRVIVKGPFDADKLTDKLCCKLCKIIKEIEIVEHKKGETKKEEQKPPPPDSHKKEKSKPPPAETEVMVEVSYTWPSDCCCHHGHGGCHCCSCGKAPSPPQPQYILTPQYVSQPYPCGGGGGGYRIVCEEDPAYACTIM